jgi:hypothetical protein
MPLRHGAFPVKSSATRATALVALALTFLAAPDARADEKEICVRAVDHAQLSRLDGKLREARAGFMTCARPVCPDAIREDCIRWVADVDASLPSLVIEAVWADGRDVTGMKVTLDGQPLPGAEAGRAFTLDPGAHTFRFDVPGAAPVESHNVVREGEKNRILRVVFTPSTLPAAVSTPASMPAAPTPPVVAAPVGLWRDPKSEGERANGSHPSPIPTSAFLFGGGALVGFGGFAYFGLSGTNRLDSLRSTCGHTCNPSDVTSARNQILVGDILAFVALAATGVATWLVVTRPDATAQ